MMAWQDTEQSGARKQYGVVPLYNEVESQFEVAVYVFRAVLVF
jgi:hypothetical protein